MQKEKTEKPDRFDSPIYKRSRVVYCLECAWVYLFSLIMTDAYLAKLLTRLGVSDAVIGIVASISSLALFAQLFTLFFNHKIKNAKTATIVFRTISLLLKTSLYFMPFIPFASNAKRVLVMAVLFFGDCIGNAMSCTYFRWCNVFISPLKRGSYGAVKEAISQVLGIVFIFSVGFTFDKLESSKNPDKCFLFIAILALALSVIEIVSLFLIGSEDESPDCAVFDNNKKAKDILENTIGNKKFRAVILQCALFAISQNFVIGFVGVFKTNSLGLSMFLIQVINIIAFVARISLSYLFGKYTDRTSYAHGLKLGYTITMLSFVFLALTTKKTWYLIIAHTVVYNVSFALIDGNSNYICYKFLPPDYFSEGMAIKNCIVGVCGFLTALIAGVILSVVQKSGTIFGIHVFAQQLLAAISVAFMIITVLFARKKIIPLFEKSGKA